MRALIMGLVLVLLLLMSCGPVPEAEFMARLASGTRVTLTVYPVSTGRPMDVQCSGATLIESQTACALVEACLRRGHGVPRCLDPLQALVP